MSHETPDCPRCTPQNAVVVVKDGWYCLDCGHEWIASASPPAAETGRLIKRYDLVTHYRAGSSIEEMEPSDDGEWVRYEDVAALAAVQRQG